MQEEVFRNHETERLQRFLKDTKFPYYNMRDKSTPSGKFLYKLTPEEVLEYSKSYEVFSVYESLAEADKMLVLQGDILISNDFSITASLSDIKGISNREAMYKPVYKVWGDLVYKPFFCKGENPWQKIPDIPGLDTVIDYVCAHELIGTVVEFSLFDVPVGIKRENLIIWELRNY